MQCPFKKLEKEEEEKERKSDEDAQAKSASATVDAKVPKGIRFPWYLAIPLIYDAEKGSVKLSDEFFDVLAASEEIAAAEARKIPVSATESLFQALRPGREVAGIAAVVAGTAVAGLAARRFGGGRHFQASRFSEALATAQ